MVVWRVEVAPSPSPNQSSCPVVTKRNPPASIYKAGASICCSRARVWMSSTQRLARIFIPGNTAKLKLSPLVSNRSPLSATTSSAACGQCRGSHFSRLHGVMASSNTQGKGGTNNVQWKEKPRAERKTGGSEGIPISKSVVNSSCVANSAGSSIDSKALGTTANISRRPYAGSTENSKVAKSGAPALPADSSIRLSYGRGQSEQKNVWAESSDKSSSSTPYSKMSGSTIDVGGRTSSAPGDRFRAAKYAGPSPSVNVAADPLVNIPAGRGQFVQKPIWVAKGYTTSSASINGVPSEPVIASPVGSSSSSNNIPSGDGQLSSIFAGQNLGTVLNGNNNVERQVVKVSLGGNFTVDKRTFAQSQIRATFYPKFENEKSDQEIRTKMIEMVSQGKATLEVSLKHSGSLFMYAGHEGGAYAKNSYGNIYTAVGVFVLGRMLQESWGPQSTMKQKEFNEFLEKNHICISGELVTAVLGDHGQRPLQDYLVITAVAELGVGKPRFYSTPDIIAFCRT